MHEEKHFNNYIQCNGAGSGKEVKRAGHFSKQYNKVPKLIDSKRKRKHHEYKFVQSSAVLSITCVNDDSFCKTTKQTFGKSTRKSRSRKSEENFPENRDVNYLHEHNLCPVCEFKKEKYEVLYPNHNSSEITEVDNKEKILKEEILQNATSGSKTDETKNNNIISEEQIVNAMSSRKKRQSKEASMENMLNIADKNNLEKNAISEDSEKIVFKKCKKEKHSKVEPSTNDEVELLNGFHEEDSFSSSFQKKSKKKKSSTGKAANDQIEMQFSSRESNSKMNGKEDESREDLANSSTVSKKSKKKNRSVDESLSNIFSNETNLLSDSSTSKKSKKKRHSEGNSVLHVGSTRESNLEESDLQNFSDISESRKHKKKKHLKKELSLNNVDDKKSLSLDSEEILCSPESGKQKIKKISKADPLLNNISAQRTSSQEPDLLNFVDSLDLRRIKKEKRSKNDSSEDSYKMSYNEYDRGEFVNSKNEADIDMNGVKIKKRKNEKLFTNHEDIDEINDCDVSEIIPSKKRKKTKIAKILGNGIDTPKSNLNFDEKIEEQILVSPNFKKTKPDKVKSKQLMIDTGESNSEIEDKLGQPVIFNGTVQDMFNVEKFAFDEDMKLNAAKSSPIRYPTDVNDVDDDVKQINNSVKCSPTTKDVKNEPEILDQSVSSQESLSITCDDSKMELDRELMGSLNCLVNDLSATEISDEIREVGDQSESKRYKKKRSKLKISTAQVYTSDSDNNDEKPPAKSTIKTKRKVVKSKRLLFDRDLEVDFVVPPLHEIFPQNTFLTREIRQTIRDKNIPIKYGKFSSIEDKQIRNNWYAFEEKFEIDHTPTDFFYLNPYAIGKHEKEVFLFHLGRHLPERNLGSIFKRFRRLFSEEKGGKYERFTKHEDKIILKMLSLKETEPNYVVKIAEKLNRTKTSVERRMKQLQMTDTRRIKWKRKKNLATFIKYMLTVTKCTNVEELKDRSISGKEWTELSCNLDNVRIQRLKQVWFNVLHPRLFMRKNRVNLAKIKVKLVNLLIYNGEKDWKLVEWKNYVPYFEGFTSLKLFHLFHDLVKLRVPRNKRHNLKKCLKVLQSCIENGDFRWKRYLTKLIYENEKVREVKLAKKASQTRRTLSPVKTESESSGNNNN